MVDKVEEEVWKTYPEYPWIEASNLGRVRTKDRWVTYKNGRKHFYEGKVLEQQIKSNGYMQVHVGVNGKGVNLLVHRIIATCFLPNPNNWPEVNHKDNNRTNNRADNLEWCDSQYNNNYKKNFGTSPKQLFGRPVFAVNLNTGEVLWFESRHEAARQLGVFQESISNVVNGKLNQAGGYWFTEDKSEITKEKIREIKAKMKSHPIIAINIETSEVFQFESQAEAARNLGASHGNISNVLKGRLNKTKGCWFCYADENAVEKTRKKFGDEVAKKVEKLMKQNQKQ